MCSITSSADDDCPVVLLYLPVLPISLIGSAYHFVRSAAILVPVLLSLRSVRVATTARVTHLLASCLHF